MRYYLVGLFDENSYLEMEKIQKSICEKYKIYRDIPKLHVTLEVVDDPDFDKLDSIMVDILKHFRKFRVETNGVICFDPPYKSVNLKIEEKGYIARLVRKINETLKNNGFRVRPNIEGWDLHVSLANTNFSIKEWSSREYMNACNTAKKDGFYNLSKIDRVELWKPINNKKDMVVRTYTLRR